MASTATQSQQQGNKLPVIGIVPSQNSTEKMVSFPERYAQAIVRAGGAPLLLPLSGDPRVYETLFPLIDGFVLTAETILTPLVMVLFAIVEKFPNILPSVRSLSISF